MRLSSLLYLLPFIAGCSSIDGTNFPISTLQALTHDTLIRAATADPVEGGRCGLVPP